MDARQKDLEQAIVKDYHTLSEAVKRLESRLYQYKGYSKSAQAVCDADDAIYNMKQQVKKLTAALEKM